MQHHSMTKHCHKEEAASQGWAILEELYCDTIPGSQNCRELVKILHLENFDGENCSSVQEAGKELVNL